MLENIHQGDVLQIEKINLPVLVVSKDFFNETGEIIGCPVYAIGSDGPLHIHISASKTEGYVHCEKLALLDLNARRFSKIDSISMQDLMNITDAIQGIFEYI